jgi:hypothetical protein
MPLLGFQRSLFMVCLNKHTEPLKPIESRLNMIVVNTKTVGKSSVIGLCGMVWWVGTWQMFTDVYSDCNGTMIYGGTCEVEKALAYFLSTGGFTPMILDGSCFFHGFQNEDYTKMIRRSLDGRCIFSFATLYSINSIVCWCLLWFKSV